MEIKKRPYYVIVVFTDDDNDGKQWFLEYMGDNLKAAARRYEYLFDKGKENFLRYYEENDLTIEYHNPIEYNFDGDGWNHTCYSYIDNEGAYDYFTVSMKKIYKNSFIEPTKETEFKILFPDSK